MLVTLCHGVRCAAEKIQCKMVHWYSNLAFSEYLKNIRNADSDNCFVRIAVCCALGLKRGLRDQAIQQGRNVKGGTTV